MENVFGAEFVETTGDMRRGGCNPMPVYHAPYEDGYADASVSGTDFINGYWTYPDCP